MFVQGSKMKDALNAKVRRSRHTASLEAETEANSEETPDKQLKKSVSLEDRVATEAQPKEKMYRVGDQIESLYRGRG